MTAPLLRLWSILFLLLLACQAWAAEEEKEKEEEGGGGNDFVDNLVSDLGPLLTLFGERFAQQFLAESFTWLDHIVFSMAPLGIITALIGAIRVGGPTWLKALIGRARENIAEAEMEFMSSTSEEVCELYNGSAIVRTMGRPTVKQIIYLESLKDKKTFGLYTLDSPESPFKGKKLPQPYVSRFKSAKASDVEVAPEKPVYANDDGELSEQAPNISLNLHGLGKPEERAFYAVIGVVLQISVLILAGIINYHSFMTNKFGDPDSPSGYPLQAIGTILLAIGMVICSVVIEESTFEMTWRVDQKKIDNALGSDPVDPKKQETPEDIYLFWLQRKHFAADHSFDAYLLAPERPNVEVLTSRRYGSDHLNVSESKSNARLKIYLANLTVFGNACGLVGFILQFQGFRLSHWLGSLFQLIAVGVMTVLRALARRGLTATPQVLELPDEYELDYTALRIAHDPDFIKNIGKEGPDTDRDDDTSGSGKDVYWRISTSGSEIPQYAENCSLKSSDGGHASDNLAQRALEIRKRLGELTKWTSAFAEEAIIIAKSIEVVMEKLVEFNEDEFYWQLRVDHNIACGTTSKQTSDVVKFKAKRIKVDGSQKGKWEVDSTEIEAALSLWNYGIWKKHQKQKISPRLKGTQDWLREVKNELFGTCYRVVCEETEASKQDLRWWVRELPLQIEDQPQQHASDNVFWWGFDGGKADGQSGATAPPDNEKRKSSGSQAGTIQTGFKRFAVSSSWKQSLGNHVFSGFMWGIAEFIQAGRFAGTRVSPNMFDLDLPDTWDTIELENSKLSEVLREIENIGLGSPDQISLSVIPPLAARNKLPNEAVVNFVHQRVLDYEAKHRWNKASRAYLKLLEMSEERGATDKFAFRAVAVTIEFLFRMTSEPLADDSDIEGDWKPIPDLKSMLTDKLSHAKLLNHVTRLNGLYADQRKELLLGDLFTCDIPTSDFEETYDYENFTDVFGWNRIQRKHIETIVTCTSTEYRTWEEIVDHISVPDIEDWRLDMNHADILGITPLRHLIEERSFTPPMWWDLIQKGRPKLEVKARDGQTVLHVAAKLDRSGVVEVLMRLVGRSDIPDHAGRTAMHLAAWVGSNGVANTLIAKYTDLMRRDMDGRTALHFSAWKGHRFISYTILQHNKAVLDIRDNDGRTALHFAAESGDKTTVERMIEINRDILGVKDKNGKTAMHVAAANEHHSIVSLLMQADAKLETAEGKAGESSQHLSDKSTHPGAGGGKEVRDLRDDEGRTPLHLAALEGDHLSVRAMLDQPDMELDIRDKQGQTPLSLACRESHAEVVKVIAEHELARQAAKDAADPRRINFNNQDNRGNTPLSHAVWYAKPDMLKALLDTQLIDVNFRTRTKLPALEFCAERKRSAKIVELLLGAKGVDVNLENDYGDTPLTVALARGHEEVALALLAADNIDINHRNGIGATPLLLATNMGDWEAAKTLIAKGAELDVMDDNCSTALMYTIEYRNDEVAELLVRAGATHAAQNPEDETPLSLAAGKGMAKILQLFLDKGVDVDFKIDGMTPLCAAAIAGQVDCVKCLIDAGADPSRLDDGGQPSFFYAVHGGNIDVAELFLKHGADVNQTTVEGQTSLFYAIKGKNVEMLKFLLDSGADPNIPDDEDGWTPIFCAVMYRDFESAELLVKSGADVTFKASNGKSAFEFSDAEDLLDEERWSKLFEALVKSSNEEAS